MKNFPRISENVNLNETIYLRDHLVIKVIQDNYIVVEGNTDPYENMKRKAAEDFNKGIKTQLFFYSLRLSWLISDPWKDIY